MIPSAENPEIQQRANTVGEDAFWSYEDLALFAGAMLPEAAIAYALTRPFHFSSEAAKTVFFQVVLYLLLLLTLYLLIVRYRRPFWSSLGWTRPFPVVLVIGGPLLAIGVAMLAAEIHAPEEPLIQNLVTNRLSLILIAIFGSFIGPLFEELVFRGFLLPLFARSLTEWGGIFATGALFALIHGPEYHWAWQILLAVGVAGVVFGIARAKTGSTAAAALLHVGYNATLFAGFLVLRAMGGSGNPGT